MTNDSHSLPIPFALGEQVWWVGNGYREESITCPECAGTKALTMIRGNGEQVSLECNYCQLGYNPPRGVVSRIYYDHRPTLFTPRRVRVDGDEITYSASEPDATCYVTAYARDLFTSQDECQARCDILNAERTRAEEDKALAMLTSKRQSLAHSVHYWGNLAKNLKKQLEQVEARLAVVKQKPEGGQG